MRKARDSKAPRAATRRDAEDISPLMRAVSLYIVGALRRPMPAAVVECTKHHLLDTLAAIVSGASLHPGKVTLAYVRSQGGLPEACVPGSRILTTATNAAFGSGMLAHADETDDAHARSGVHPGCGVVPAALAMAESVGANGTQLLRATALGYDISTRLSMSLGAAAFFNAGFCLHSFGTIFGAAAAAGALARFNTTQVRHLLSYTAQSASGVGCYHRDIQHFEKSYDHGGRSARDAVAATTMVAAGFTGVDDAFSGDKNFFFAFSRFAKPELLAQGLGETYEVVNTGIKRWTTGVPTQAVLDSLSELIRTHSLQARDVEKAVLRVSHHGHRITNDRVLPNICMQHLAAVMLLDGTVTFDSAHDVQRMRDPKVRGLRRRIEFYGDDELERALPAYHGIVELALRGGRVLRHHTQAVRGSAQNPMNRQEVDEKCYALFAPVLGKKRSRALIDAVWDIEGISDVRKLRGLLRA